jgi:hypothetical protein
MPMCACVCVYVCMSMRVCMFMSMYAVYICVHEYVIRNVVADGKKGAGTILTMSTAYVCMFMYIMNQEYRCGVCVYIAYVCMFIAYVCMFMYCVCVYVYVHNEPGIQLWRTTMSLTY